MSNLTYYLTTEHGIEGADADASDQAATQLEALRDQAVFDGEWDPDVEHLEHGVLVPLGQARIVDSGACAEAPFLDQVDYAIQEPYDFDAAEFWRVLIAQAPKLAAKLADAAPSPEGGEGG